MLPLAGVCLLVACAAHSSESHNTERKPSTMNHSEHSGWGSARDRALEPVINARESDWRCGAVIYHIFVDRFVEPTPEELEAKRHLYPKPKVLRSWDEQPRPGRKLADVGVWSHEIEFWGGDLVTLRRGLDHVESLGVDVVYLNPIHAAYTNHKYDAQDYWAVSPDYGTREDVLALVEDLRERDMRLMLDGVFNHMGRTAPAFIEAQQDPKSPWRAWFEFGDEFPAGYRAWYNARNLPEVTLENKHIRDRLWNDPDSVVRGYLRDGIAGWRLDVAYDYGFDLLAELNAAAKAERPDAWIVGEIWNYPEEWLDSIDGVMNFHQRRIINDLVHGRITGGNAGRMIERMIEDCGIEGILRSWNMLDNHDTERLATMFPEEHDRMIAQVLQMTLPGSPLIYYGVEAGMTGGGDPEMRGPMDWDALTDENPEFQRLKRLLEIRAGSRALRIGEFRLLDTTELLAFQRRTDRWEETRFIVINASGKPVSEVVALRDSKLMNFAPLIDEITGKEVTIRSGLAEFTIPPKTVWILRPREEPADEYSPYKRMR